MYVQGDLAKPELYDKLRGALADADKVHGTQGNAIFYLAVADRLFASAVEQLGKAKLTDQETDENGKRRFWRRVVIEKPFGHSLDSARETERLHPAHGATRTRSSGSTTFSARTRSRASWRSVSPMDYSNRSGTATGSITCRSPRRRRSASRGAAVSTRRPARCATWCPITCSRCSRWWPWSRPPASTPPRSVQRKSKC